MAWKQFLLSVVGAVLLFCAEELRATAEDGGHPATDSAAEPITNGAVWKAGRPPVEREVIFEPAERDWKYSHHQSIAVFNLQLLAIWSSAERDEDSPGQRVMYAVSSEAGQWSRPRVLFQPEIDPDGRLRVLTAAGFHQHNGTLVAYAGDYSIDRKSTRLLG